MDPAQYFKSCFQDLHKTKGGDFGRAMNTDVRVNQMNEHRRKTRNDYMLQKRLIREDGVKKSDDKPIDTQQKERLAQLTKWKKEKAMRLQEQKLITKPVFKISRVPSAIPMPALPKLNKRKQVKMVTTDEYNFAPRNYKFHGPVNIKPVNVHPQVQPPSTNNFKRVTRSQKHILSPLRALPTRQRRTNTMKLKSLDLNIVDAKDLLVKEITIMQNGAGQKSTVKTIGKKACKKTPARSKNHVRTNDLELQTQEYQSKLEDGVAHYSTPSISSNTPINYVSPFVTISRGKNSARKEYFNRKSKGGMFDASPELLNSTGPKASAAYFHQLLNREIARIQGLCDEWNLYMNEQSPPEGACEMINVAIGQSQLLIGKKFKKFKELINSCENNDLGRVITSEDLHGYWDTSYIQVENLDRRFKNLEDLRANNWEEIIPEKTVAQPKTKVAKNPKKKVTSKLRDVVRAARHKALTNKTDNLDVNTFDAGFFSIHSPQKSPVVGANSISSAKKGPQTRKSLLKSVLSSEVKRGTHSPGLIVVTATQGVRSIEAFSELEDTPAKSILKIQNGKSSVKKSKSVLFRSTNSPNDENSPSTLLSPVHTAKPQRRSSRLTRSKLF